MDDNLAPSQRLEGASPDRKSLQPLDRLRLAMSRHEVEILAVVSPKCTVRGIAQAHCLLNHRLEHRR
jgi:hypothetical protein